MATKKNIIVGAASIFISDGVTLTVAPSAVAATSYRTTMQSAAGFRDVGYTQDGLSVSNDPSFTDIPVDQLLDSAKIFQEGMSVMLTTTFAEATLENLLVAWNQAPSTLTSTASDKTWLIDGGALGAQPLERVLVAVGPGIEKPNSNAYTERSYTATRVLSIESSEHTLARSDATTVPVSFRALPDDNGKYGTVRERNV